MHDSDTAGHPVMHNSLELLVLMYYDNDCKDVSSS